LEAVLSLFLVVLLGSFVFQILRTLQQSAHDLAMRSSNQEVIVHFSTALRGDMDLAQRIYGTPGGGLACHQDTAVVLYAPSALGIVRHGAHGDTVLFRIPVKRTSAVELMPGGRLVALWKIMCDGPDSTSLAFQKVYAPADRIREHTNHGDQDTSQP